MKDRWWEVCDDLLKGLNEFPWNSFTNKFDEQKMFDELMKVNKLLCTLYLLIKYQWYMLYLDKTLKYHSLFNIKSFTPKCHYTSLHS